MHAESFIIVDTEGAGTMGWWPMAKIMDSWAMKVCGLSDYQ